MRQARFSGLGGGTEGGTLSLPALLSLDFRAAPKDDESLVVERARTISVAVPLLACWHVVWMAILLHGLWTAGALASPVPIVLAGILLLDLALWTALRRPRRAAHSQVRLAAAYILVTGTLWIAAALLAAAGPAADSLAVRAALIAGAGSSLPAFFLVPALVASSCVVAWLASFALAVDPSLLVVGAALDVVLVWLSLFRARDQILAGRHRLRLEAEAEKAGRFVEDYEASGRGWFWETNADGLLTYASEPLAGALGLDRGAVLGRRFEELLPDGAGNPLGFQLSARFPFSDVMVRAPGGGDNWWSLSGRPNFDRYGRFLGFRGLGANLSEQQRGEAETKRLARFDSLTGLPNRATMRTMLDTALANASERRQGCALLMIDLDRFKQVNDTFGHPVGDKLLKKVAARLTAVIGDRGEVGRLGGDEFEAILPGYDAEGALAELARALIAEICRPYVVDGHRLEIGTSVGVAVARPGKACAAGLVRDADLALYAAKAAGRGTFRFFAPEMHAEAADRQRLEQDLREALAGGQLRLLFQPIVDAGSEELLAFEALLRWQHPTRGVVPPAILVPLAEESGLMPTIGDWILRTACAEAVTWPGHIRVAVNLSPVQLADPALPATLTATLAHTGLDPDRLELEVNEIAYLAAGAAADSRLERLKRIGIRLVLDNFGTGQVGLGALRTAPLDKLKIDRGFAAGAAAPGSRSAAIMRGIVVLAESLGMDTTAEGVETPAQMALVRRLGCRQAQGFLLAPPLAAGEALARAAESRPTAEVIGFSRPPRHRLIRNGRLRCDGRSLPVRLRNISEGGAMIECEVALAPGTEAILDLDEAGVVAAQVRWCQRGQLGLSFGKPFNLALLGRARTGTPAAPKMVTPRYLEAGPAAEPAGPSPLATKRRRSG
jgi:diguanylate cyclase (GGDEF)-like protein